MYVCIYLVFQTGFFYRFLGYYPENLFELRDPPAAASRVLGLKACVTNAQPISQTLTTFCWYSIPHLNTSYIITFLDYSHSLTPTLHTLSTHWACES
ncbi:hypothetical protein I79_006144 [Cricetulus griseus]|uniref:Uncharacterized protein n=1 Tax=Cricetulus griseus TaxID=10029 RepID=G3H719_CRIGR|nr:hypothetical protein I79_006144 [Cricetulus griseus]